MSGKAILTGVAVVFWAGLFIGHSNSPEPEIITKTKVEIIRVPEVITHVSTVTKNVQTPFPEACKEAIEILKKIKAQDAAISEASGKYTFLIPDARSQIARKRYIALTDTIDDLNAAEGRLSLAIGEKASSLLDFEYRMKRCNNPDG